MRVCVVRGGGGREETMLSWNDNNESIYRCSVFYLRSKFELRPLRNIPSIGWMGFDSSAL